MRIRRIGTRIQRMRQTWQTRRIRWTRRFWWIQRARRFWWIQRARRFWWIQWIWRIRQIQQIQWIRRIPYAIFKRFFSFIYSATKGFISSGKLSSELYLAEA